MRALLALSLILLSTMATANHPLPPVPDGLTVTATLDCSDGETGEIGFCIYFIDATGIRWLAFYQRDETAMIRKIAPDGTYETVWRADWFHSI